VSFALNNRKSSIARLPNFLLGMLGPFAFPVFLFCHPFGGRDSLKISRIPEETGGSSERQSLRSPAVHEFGKWSA